MTQPEQNPLGDNQLAPLRLDFPKSFAQLLGEYVQLAPASRDPLQLGQPRSLPAIRWCYPHGDGS
ncbi:hypothetical protein ABZ504_42665 [Streptomyces mirabilis]|uniref:hypothetical protein n=1 Tax=Streptomyces mirabilis TaxID=68239 RepID=UPI0034000CE9